VLSVSAPFKSGFAGGIGMGLSKYAIGPFALIARGSGCERGRARKLPPLPPPPLPSSGASRVGRVWPHRPASRTRSRPCVSAPAGHRRGAVGARASARARVRSCPQERGAVLAAPCRGRQRCPGGAHPRQARACR
jgi:hypothetical protein